MDAWLWGRTGWGIFSVVPHEAEPPRKAAEHVVAQELHRITEYSNRPPSPRRLVRASRNRVESATDVTPSPPASVGANRPPRIWLLTKTFSSSARPCRRKDQITVLPPSTRTARTPRFAK